MSKEELLKLLEDEEVREKLKEYTPVKLNIWTRYTRDYIKPKLTEIYNESNRMVYQVSNAINALVKAKMGKKNVSMINEEELEIVKPIIDLIIEELRKGKQKNEVEL